MDGSTSVLTIAVGLYVGMSLSQFFTAITRDLFAPFIAAIFPGVQASVDKLVIQLGPVKLNIGDAIGATMNLLIAWFIVSTTLPYLKSYAPIGGRR
jgi:large-conductance mechanosensitive channel